MKTRLSVAALLALTAGAVAQTPLRLDYCVQPGGLGTQYKFTLTLDNHDNSWAAGQGFGWIIFGDSQTTSPINDFQMDATSFPIGPFTQLQGSGGGHNGPTLGPVVIFNQQTQQYDNNLWVPTAVGDSITWTGSSATNVPAGQMLWSNLMAGSAEYAAFEVGNIVSCGGAACYANCDSSTATPVLNANDFQCFLNQFAAGASYANCDGSTAVPVLTANDFQCFLNKFAAGCT